LKPGGSGSFKILEIGENRCFRLSQKRQRADSFRKEELANHRRFFMKEPAVRKVFFSFFENFKKLENRGSIPISGF
jgi:hypothetical protein